jgi:phenylpropionate dioxygenase-like ring-hydroxylating dioxygenase large terminal subunit
MTNARNTESLRATVKTREGREIPHGASQVGVFDLVPTLGYREYWYPAIHDGLVKKKPVSLKMLGEELVFFRDENGEVQALSDYCPHRGARLSGGKRRVPGGGPQPGKLNNEFKGFITCPYHGYTFNGEGVCVAALTDGPNSGLVGKLRAPKYPTQTYKGIVWIWMGETEPVPLEEDIFYLGREDYIWDSYARIWDLNWSLTIENSQDSHEGKIHRGSPRRIWTLQLFRGRGRGQGAYWGGSKITKEGDNHFNISPLFVGPRPKGFYPGLDKHWPQHTWWKVLKGPRQKPRKPDVPLFDPERRGGLYALPAIASPGNSTDSCYFRIAVPVTADTCRMWCFRISRKSIVRGAFARLRWHMNFHYWFTYSFIQGINENEDLPVQSIGCLDPWKPQKLGGSDASTIYWRRRLPLRSRDYVRLWSQQKLEETEEVMEQMEERELIEEPINPYAAPAQTS